MTLKDVFGMKILLLLIRLPP